jgi:hypothetical protein
MKNGRTERPGKRRLGIRKRGISGLMMGVTQSFLFFAEYTYAYVIEDQRGGVSRFYARADGGLVLLIL